MSEHIQHDEMQEEEVPGPPAPALHYRFEFLFDAAPGISAESLQSVIATSFRDVHVSGEPADWNLALAWGEADEQFALTSRTVEPGSLTASVEQSWQWREAESVASRATHALRLTHHLTGSPSLEGRVALLRKLVAVLIENLTPAAVHLIESSQLMDPSSLHEAFVEDPYDPLFGFMNIRLYKVEGHERGITAHYDETIMDTLGLHALGLPDLQMHFKHLDPSMVARLLDDSAHYLLEKGAVIESGHSIRGFADGQKFDCSFEGSIVDPWRLVIEIDPGKPYSLRSPNQSIVV